MTWTGWRHFGQGLLAGLLTGVVCAQVVVNESGGLAPGSLLVDMRADEIRLLSYASRSTRLTAQRGYADAPFLVQATFTLRERAAERCHAAPDQGGNLQQFFRFIARRPLSPTELASEFPVQVGILRLEGTVGAIPPVEIVVFTNAERTAVAAVLDEKAAELETQAGIFERLEDGCAALDSPPVDPHHFQRQ